MFPRLLLFTQYIPTQGCPFCAIGIAALKFDLDVHARCFILIDNFRNHHVISIYAI